MDSIVLENERHLAGSVADARMAIVRSLRAQDFTLTNEQVSMIGAKRGSQFAGSVQPKKLPVSVKVMLQPDGDGCVVSIRIADAWRSGVGKVWGMNGPFRTVIDEIQRALDDALAPLAASATPFAQNEVQTATGDVPILTQATTATARAGAAAGGAVGRALDGPNRDPHRALKEVVLRSSKGVASFDRMGVQALFTVGLLVSSKPGAMPPNLARDVEALSAKLETAVAQHPEGQVVVEIGDDEIPVAEFLGKQADIRMALPLRTLQVCTTCKLEKVVNPDFKKLQERNQRKRVLTGAVGATVTSSGLSPFLAIGSLMKLKNFDIPFVCNRCQGLDADSSIVTYCPRCGERRGEAVLRSCQRCKYNFVAAHDHDHPEEFWLPEAVRAGLPAPMPGGFPAPAPAPVLAPAPYALPTPAAVPTPAAFPLPVAANAATLQPPTTPVTVPQAPLAQAPLAQGPAPGWYPDTTGRHHHRYWDGRQWTAHVSDNGSQSHDPV